MPTDTFFNLPADKQARIMAAAIAEFSQKRFSEASINKIVKNAAIPRGSFYQYFADKEDIYMLVMTHITKEKLAHAQRLVITQNDVANDSHADFAETMLFLSKSMFTWAREHPNYYRIGQLMMHDDSLFITELIKSSDSSQQFFHNLLRRDMEKGLVRPDVDIQLVFDIITSYAQFKIDAYYQEDTPETEEDLLRGLRELFVIIKGGIQNAQD